MLENTIHNKTSTLTIFNTFLLTSTKRASLLVTIRVNTIRPRKSARKNAPLEISVHRSGRQLMRIRTRCTWLMVKWSSQPLLITWISRYGSRTLVRATTLLNTLPTQTFSDSFLWLTKESSWPNKLARQIKSRNIKPLSTSRTLKSTMITFSRTASNIATLMI